jgi:hypothetical protein
MPLVTFTCYSATFICTEEPKRDASPTPVL